MKQLQLFLHFGVSLSRLVFIFRNLINEFFIIFFHRTVPSSSLFWDGFVVLLLRPHTDR